jgi:hypothetical protein
VSGLNQTRKLRITILALAVLIAGGFLVLQGNADSSAPKLAKSYTNDTHHFSLMMPADFAASILPASDDVGEMVILQNAEADGVQIIITPWDEGVDALTPERIANDTGHTPTDAQPIEIPNGAGLSFHSDNDAFDGAASDIWFVHEGTLFQLTTYARLEPLLHAVFATWRFF